MDHSPTQSGLEVAAANLRLIWAAILAGFGNLGVEAARQGATYNWVSGILCRFDRLLARYRAGRVWRGAPRVAISGQSGVRVIVRKPAMLRMPRRWAWLVITGKHHAAGYGGQLQYCVLNTPEMAEFLEHCPQAKRILRPLLRALAVELAWTVTAPRAQPKPRVRKPRPKPPSYPGDERISWQRGEKTWSRKERQMERLLKLKHELVAKIAQARR